MNHKYIRTEDKIFDINDTDKCIYVIRDSSIKKSESRYVSYLCGDNWRKHYLMDYQNCILFSYNAAQNFISNLIKENLEYQNLVIELSPYYKGCRQADTIKELCDEFVVFDEMNKCCMEIVGNYSSIENNGWIGSAFEIYGAIWTDKGLIYVAKMNEKGELVLI